MEIILKTYVFSAHWYDSGAKEYKYKTIVIENCIDIISAMKQMKDRCNTGSEIIIDNIYSENRV